MTHNNTRVIHSPPYNVDGLSVRPLNPTNTSTSKYTQSHTVHTHTLMYTHTNTHSCMHLISTMHFIHPSIHSFTKHIFSLSFTLLMLLTHIFTLYTSAHVNIISTLFPWSVASLYCTEVNMAKHAPASPPSFTLSHRLLNVCLKFRYAGNVVGVWNFLPRLIKRNHHHQHHQGFADIRFTTQCS